MLTKKRVKNILIISIYFLLFLLFIVLEIKWNCPFNKYLNIACPACGITRSIKALINLNIIASIKYNVLGIPLLLFVIISFILIIIDIIKNDDKFIKNILNILSKYYALIFLMLIIVMIINNVNGI